MEAPLSFYSEGSLVQIYMLRTPSLKIETFHFVAKKPGFCNAILLLCVGWLLTVVARQRKTSGWCGCTIFEAILARTLPQAFLSNHQLFAELGVARLIGVMRSVLPY